jgi:O-antigen/teichoic acid export membrane protein
VIKSAFRNYSEFSKNVITLITGTAISQAIPVLISPLLTRLYTPEDFGLFSIYFAIVMVLSVVATGRYELAILLPRKTSEARDLMHLCVAIALSVALLLSFVIIGAAPQIARTFSLQDNVHLLFFLPLGVFLVGLSQSAYYYLNRNKKYFTMMAGRMSRSTGYAVSSITFGMLAPSGIGLICSDIVGYATNCFVMISREKIPVRWKLNRERARNLLLKYGDFPRYMMVSGLLEKGAGQTPVFLLNLLFHSANSIGYFTLAMRVVAVPTDLIARSISDVFRQKAAEIYSKQLECREIFLKTVRKLTFLALPFAILGFFLIEDAFTFAFGADWSIAGEYARIMLPLFFLQFVVSPVSIMFVIAQKQRYDLAMQTFLLSMTILSFIVGFYVYHDTAIAIKLFTGAYCAKYVIELVLSYRLSRGV